MLGEFFKDKPRESFVIATKVVPGGLDRLQMDYVDILYNHVVSTREGTMHEPTLLQAALEEGSRHGLGFIAMKNMAGGYHDEEKTQPVNGKAALKWALKNPNITTCIPGFSSFDQLNDDLKVMTDLMRAYMYSHGYRNMEKARYVLDHYIEGSDPCSGCTSCTVKCTKGFRVDERIAYVSRLKDVPEDFIV